MLGLGVMWAWNALTCCLDFFTYRFHSEEVRYSYPWLFCLPWAICQTVVFCYIFQVSYTLRVVVSFTLNAMCLVGIGVVCHALEGKDGAVLTGCIVVLLGANTSVLSASVLGLASILPQAYVKAANVGMGISGFVPPAIKLILLNFYPGRQIHCLLIFLAISAVIALLCIFAVLYIEHNEFASFYFSVSSSPGSPKGDYREKLIPEELATRLAEVNNVLASPKDYSIQKIIRRTNRSLKKAPKPHKESLYLAFNDDEDGKERGYRPVLLKSERESVQAIGTWGVLREIWLHWSLLFLCSYQTYVQIPGLVFLYHYRSVTRAWGEMMAVGIFRLSIFLGALSAYYSIGNFKVHSFFLVCRLAVLWVTRIAVQTCPDVTICHGEDCFPHDTVFSEDWFRVCLLLVMGGLQGYIASCLMALARNKVDSVSGEDKDLEMTGYLMSIALTLGQTAGFIHCHMAYYEYVPTFYCGT